MTLKAAGDATTVHDMQGRLILSKSGWLLLEVPNALVLGAFQSIREPGAVLPLKDGRLNAHISVMRKEEVDKIGPDKINERGKHFRYTLGPMKTVNPTSWDGVSKVWYLTALSPELRKLRVSYGLSPQPNEDWDFHVTVAVRKTGVLQNNGVSKAAEAAPNYLTPSDLKDAISAGIKDHAAGRGAGLRSCLLHTIWPLLHDANKKPGDILPGGLADGKPDSAFPAEALAEGAEVESEHVAIPQVAKEIAKDHLTEDPQYYPKLEKMEEGAEKKAEEMRGVITDVQNAIKYPSHTFQAPSDTHNTVFPWHAPLRERLIKNFTAGANAEAAKLPTKHWNSIGKLNANVGAAAGYQGIAETEIPTYTVPLNSAHGKTRLATPHFAQVAKETINTPQQGQLMPQLPRISSYQAMTPEGASQRLGSMLRMRPDLQRPGMVKQQEDSSDTVDKTGSAIWLGEEDGESAAADATTIGAGGGGEGTAAGAGT